MEFCCQERGTSHRTFLGPENFSYQQRNSVTEGIQWSQGMCHKKKKETEWGQEYVSVEQTSCITGYYNTETGK